MGSAIVPRLRESLAGDAAHYSTFVQIPDPHLVEALARTRLHSMILDCQHAMFTESSISPAVATAALAGKPVLVRLPVGDYAFGSKVLDLGAAGVVCPMVNTVAQARDLVAHVKYPPIGARSWGPRRAQPLAGLSGAAYLKGANDLLMAFAMIETREALANLDAILAVDGIDGAFLGPMDLSVSLSNGARLGVADAEVQAAIDAIGRAARRAGKTAGVFALDGAEAKDYVARGYRFIALAQDAMFLAAGAEAALTSAGA